MFKKPISQSQSFAGSIEGNTTITQSGGDSHITVNNNAQQDKQITIDELLNLLSQIENLARNSNLPDDKSETAISHIKDAIKEVKQNEPSKEYVARSLKRFVDLLKDSNLAVTELQKLQPILAGVAGWLGTARHILGI